MDHENLKPGDEHPGFLIWLCRVGIFRDVIETWVLFRAVTRTSDSREEMGWPPWRQWF
ncbi:hypothetical protein [Desulfoluna sp.]|uniref:hypothetical protein n=1 Tax=Desulfoluna sp. TaxID=2045199 RepID=UPI0026353380|nr:hypothetical protein [Desulfoluna sp.]